MNNLSHSELEEIRLQMLKFARLQLSDANLAEDLVQETFESAYKHAESFRQESALKTWIFAILKNKIIDVLKRKKRTITFSDLVEEDSLEHFFDETGHWKNEVSEWQSAQSEIYQKEFWAILSLCLNKLPPQQARVFMMRTHLGLSSEEVCQTCDISLNNLNVLLYRARLQLQECLTKNWFNGEKE